MLWSLLGQKTRNSCLEWSSISLLIPPWDCKKQHLPVVPVFCPSHSPTHMHITKGQCMPQKFSKSRHSQQRDRGMHLIEGQCRSPKFWDKNCYDFVGHWVSNKLHWLWFCLKFTVTPTSLTHTINDFMSACQNYTRPLQLSLNAYASAVHKWYYAAVCMVLT